MPGKILGLDINEDFIAAVQVTGSLKGYQVTACAHAPINDEGGLESAFGEVFSQADLKSDVCHSAVSAGHASYRNLQLPFKDQKKIRQTLPFEIEAMVPFAIQDMVVDYVLVDRTEQSRLLAALVKKGLVQEHLQRLQSQGVDPDILDIRGVPLVLWLMRQEDTPENGLFLQIEKTNITMALFINKRIALMRTFSLNGGWLAPGASEDQFESLCIRIRNTIHGYGVQSQQTLSLEKIYVSCTEPFPSTAWDFLKGFFELPVEPLDLKKSEKIHMEPATAENWRAGVMDNALALALRDAKPAQGFNFRRDEFEKRRQYFGSLKEIRTAAVFLIILLCFLVGNMGADYYFLKKRNNSLDRQMTAVFTETLPHIRRIVDPYKQMKAELANLKNASFSGPEINLNESVLDILKEISERIPYALDVLVTRMVVDSENVRISGTTGTYDTVNKIKSNMEASEHFRSATIASAKQDKSGDKVIFEITLERTVTP